MVKYIKTIQERSKAKVKIDPFENIQDRAIKKFKYWFIVENDFPYDGVATVSHMILPIRRVVFKWDLLTKEEREELDELKKTYISDNYDAIQENMPSRQTVPGYFHLHLLTFKREKYKEEEYKK